jgi:predicted nucleotidyltransferase component of viral defense system
MLTTNQLRQSAARSGARDIANVEIDAILTYLLQLFHEQGLTEHLAFKGGTMLRKMVFGPRGRLSTDLDFTCRTEIHLDDLTVKVLDALEQPYHGLAFRFDKQKDWYPDGRRLCRQPRLLSRSQPGGRQDQDSDQ